MRFHRGGSPYFAVLNNSALKSVSQKISRLSQSVIDADRVERIGDVVAVAYDAGYPQDRVPTGQRGALLKVEAGCSGWPGKHDGIAENGNRQRRFGKDVEGIADSGTIH